MILREIELDLPYISRNHVTDNHQQNYDETWKMKRCNFQLMTRCMTAMIERLMPLIHTNNCRKLLIECVEQVDRRDYVDSLGVYIVQVKFDASRFFDLTDYEKKKSTIDIVKKALENESLNGILELDDLKNICDQIAIQDYTNVWIWKINKKRRKEILSIKVCHDVQSVNIYMVYENINEGRIEERLLVSEKPDEYLYTKYLGKLDWISDNQACLISKEGEKYVEIF